MTSEQVDQLDDADHLAPELRRVRFAAVARAALDVELSRASMEARTKAGHSWRAIGTAGLTTRQNATQRWGATVAHSSCALAGDTQSEEVDKLA